MHYDFAYSLLKDDSVKQNHQKVSSIYQSTDKSISSNDGLYINFKLDGEFNETVESPIHEKFSILPLVKVKK